MNVLKGKEIFVSAELTSHQMTQLKYLRHQIDKIEIEGAKVKA